MRRWIILICAWCLITAVSAQDQSPPYFVEVEVSNATPFLSEQIIYTVRFFDSVGNSSSAYVAPTFEGFWHVDLGITNQYSEVRGDQTYTVTSISTVLFANRIGAIEIPSPEIRLTASANEPQRSLASEPITINVQVIPDSDRSPTFSGLVGILQMDAILDDIRHREGEPFILTLTLTGTADLERLAFPAVFDEWRTVVGPSNYQHEFDGRILLGTRTLELRLYPPETGRLVLPAITIEYYDPSVGEYGFVATAPRDVEIVASGVSDSQPAASLNRLMPRLRIPNYDGILLVSSGLLFLIPGSGLVGVSIWRRTRRYRELTRRMQQHRQAMKIASRRLQGMEGQNKAINPDSVQYVVVDFVKSFYHLNDDIRWEGIEDQIPAHAQARFIQVKEIVHELKFASSYAHATDTMDRLQRALTQWDATVR
jgi:hypothetical protein